jgi:hypothetical protein
MNGFITEKRNAPSLKPITKFGGAHADAKAMRGPGGDRRIAFKPLYSGERSAIYD